MQGYTTDGKKKVTSSGGGGGSQTPLLSDVDVAGFKFTDNGGDSYLQLKDPITGQIKLVDGAGSGMEISSSGGNIDVIGVGVDFHGQALAGVGSVSGNGSASALSLNPDASFGIHNVEAAGVGADINLVSDNGNVVIPGKGYVGVYPGFIPDGALPTFTLWADTAHSGTNNVFGVLSNGDVGDGGVIIKPNMASQYGEDAENIGNVQGTNTDLNAVKNLAIQGEGGNLYVGAMLDDGSLAKVQVTGSVSISDSYLAQGQQGITTTDGAGTFVGGIRVA